MNRKQEPSAVPVQESSPIGSDTSETLKLSASPVCQVCGDREAAGRLLYLPNQSVDGIFCIFCALKVMWNGRNPFPRKGVTG